MLVYGDRESTADPLALLSDIGSRAADLREIERGILWHQACVQLFIATAGLLQGIADAEFAAAGEDEGSPAQTIMMTALRRLAHAIDRSWTSAFAEQDIPDLALLDTLDPAALPVTVTVRRCEGYAFYALYPEQYLAAARRIPADACVIGLRSIGTGLAALVAAACDAEFVCTLRPTGDVYARTVVVGAGLAAALHARRDRCFAIVDEGPGQSGSSFGGVADYLETIGVAPDRILFVPSHAGNPGPAANPAQRRRWATTERLTAPFDILLDPAAPGLPDWFADLTGPATGPLRDISGGRWREVASARTVPIDPGRERRKYLLPTAHGTILLKFVGLDAQADAQFDRACQLYRAALTPEPLAARYGFLAERWIDDARTPEPAEIRTVVASYLAVRATAFPAQSPGASLADLVLMARYNIAQAVGPVADPLFARWTPERIAALQHHVRPVHGDARMHRWEWIVSGTRILKTDAVDHAEAHDLVGCQDIAWDIAGAAIELELSPFAREDLVRSVCPERPHAAHLTALLTLCYLGFQIGWWDFATDRTSAEERRRFYTTKLADLIAARS